MAAPLLLRQGRAGALKILLPEVPALRGLASTGFLSAESGKSTKGLSSNPKKQSTPKNVVEPKERGKLLPTHTAAELSKTLPWPHSDPPVVNKAGTAIGPGPDHIMPSADEAVPRFLSRKTSVAFPQKVSSPFRKQCSESETRQKSRETAGASSSSSSSSSSDSESDEEGQASGVGPRVASKARGRFPEPEASAPSFENRTPKAVTPTKEKSRSPKPRADYVYPETPHRPETEGSTGQRVEGKKDAKPRTAIPKPEAGGDFLKQNINEKQLQKIGRLNKRDKESHKPVEVKNLPGLAESGLSTQSSGHAGPAVLTGEATAGTRLQAASSATRRDNLEKQVPEPNRKVASPFFREENSGMQVGIGKSKGAFQTKEDVLEDQVPEGNVETVPDKSNDLLAEKIPGLSLEEKGEIIEDSATEVGDQVGTQAMAEAAAPAEPFDISTYKNLQHHEYSTYTFLDLNLNLSKFRMPQPSSGRESPRH
ncbi:NADH dehydrogenase [ubiquinone] flavoprotein 3, mitochondrial isoform X1 [Tamandua tetradactyla]|uniref:NADH dehydrogenase [ubiquinone] flavoprotein 3, mitochondrial isoform X1 n=1 Tax=Tamandua tetradactyla TaxID=48850 RepID=UPI0040542EA2